MSFSSENFSGAHPAFIEAIKLSNTGKVPSYGKDKFTIHAENVIRQNFKKECDVYFLFNGTGGNNFAIASCLRPFNSIFCSDVSHIYLDESTAPESFLNCRIYPVQSKDGKLDGFDLKEKLNRVGDFHHPQPRVLSLSQPTEYGTVYSPEEVRLLSLVATDHGMILHMDGARFFNAAVALDCSLNQLVKHADILTLGGTKNGMLFGEAVLFFNKTRSYDNIFYLKRSMQLASKMRFISVQFEAMFKNNLWYGLAAQANNMARYFSVHLKQFPHIKITRPVETNAVFAIMTEKLYQQLQQHATFYLWSKKAGEVRFMFSFDTTITEIDAFMELVKFYSA